VVYLANGAPSKRNNERVLKMTEGTKNRERRVALITDTAQHIGPYVAKELAERDHDLVISDPNVVIEGAPIIHPDLVAELKAMGGRVEVVDVDDVNKEGSVQKLVDRAMEVFGGFDSAFIRPGVHLVGPWEDMTAEDYTTLFVGNELSTFYALQAVVPPLVAQGSGQVLIEASATAEKFLNPAFLYGATRAAAKYLINTIALDVAPKGVSVNGMGTNFCDYPGFRDTVHCHTDEEVAEWAKFIPEGRLGPPEEIAHLAAALLDGKCNYYAAQFACMSGGWNGN
jgi:NAD(P)-dependent dehydrogenase (short-subunit alcohol dehydrogenase family)